MREGRDLDLGRWLDDPHVERAAAIGWTVLGTVAVATFAALVLGATVVGL